MLTFLVGFSVSAVVLSAIQIDLPLKINARYIIDQSGNKITLGCVNWYGAHMEDHVVNGLNAQTITSIAKNIRDMGFNCVRLPFSTEMSILNPTISNQTVVSANPDLIGLSSLEVFDAVISALTSFSIMVILNNHIGKAGWCCSTEDGEGLWYSNYYTVDEFYGSWIDMANRYASNPFVIGADLRNELRYGNGITPTWGSGDPASDWALAATICGNQILQHAPDWLIIVEGVDYSTNLVDVRNHPIKLSIPNRVVYSPHDYSWSQDLTTYSQFRTHLDESWGYILTENMTYTAPLWLGEFGTNTADNWWTWIRQYILEKDMSWSYWALDGEQRVGVDESFGIFLQDYSTIRHEWKLLDLQDLLAKKPVESSFHSSSSNSTCVTAVVDTRKKNPRQRVMC